MPLKTAPKPVPCGLNLNPIEEQEFPFGTKLDLKLFSEKVHQIAEGDICPKALKFSQTEPDPSSEAWVKEFKEVASPFFIRGYSPTYMQAFCEPFRMDYIAASQDFKDTFIGEDGEFLGKTYLDSDSLAKAKCLHAIQLILERVYKIPFNYQPAIVFSSKGKNGILPKYYQFRYDTQFIDVDVIGPKPELDVQALDQMTDSFLDTDKWLEIIPPSSFQLRGVGLLNASDVTGREVISGLHRELKQGTLISSERISKVQQYIRILLGLPKMHMRVSTFESQSVFVLDGLSAPHEGCIIANSREFPMSEVANTNFCKITKGAQRLWSDLSELKEKPELYTPFLHDPETHGIEGILSLPMVQGEQVIGCVELAGPKFELCFPRDPVNLAEVVTSLSEALVKSREDLNNRVQSLIQKHCTAIHPAVEWKFKEVGRKALEKLNSEVFNDIAFPDVYPLFSESDIQASSKFRNEAIQKDLNDQLHAVKDILHLANQTHAMPIFEEVNFRIDQKLERLKGELNSSDEMVVQNFLKQEVNELLLEVKELSPQCKAAVEKYDERISLHHGMFHDSRNEYEKAVSAINHRLAQEIDQEQNSAQLQFPHYAEKNLTDGVELSIYVGKSMMENQHWSDIYLKNLRLWQLMLTCRLARTCMAMEPELSLPLKVTHLILVQDMPLSIAFSQEEKEFVVEGSYNIRYAIMKKRIDKATVNGSNERLTQAGKIAIVYSHENEAREYRHYLQYLIDRHYLSPKIEELELEALQSLQGLKALRVEVLPERRAVDREPHKSIAEGLNF
jgi:hypothetical protein